MTKFKLLFNKDEETVWINDLAEQGWAMRSFFGGFYSFERCQPGEYIYQIDFADKFGHLSRDYRDFMEEMGVEIVCQWGFWVILRRHAQEGPFELYTDVESTMEHYRKIRTMFKVVTLFEIICFFVEMIAIFNGSVGILPAALIILALILVLMREISRINSILDELGKRQGQPAEGVGWRRRKPSLLLPAGMLLNAIALLISNVEIPGYDTVKHVLQVTAIVLMVVGIYRTAHRL